LLRFFRHKKTACWLNHQAVRLVFNHQFVSLCLRYLHL